METKALKLRENFYWAGVVDNTLRVFDIIMHTEFGTTYNSYVYKAGEQVILFETVKEDFFEEYCKKLEEIADVTRIDYLVLNHTEPDHAGSVERLLEKNPGLKILATGTALSFLQNIVNRDFTGIAVRDEQEMEIGGITLRFLHVPNLHWPDTMYTYLKEDRVLLTCDSFGSHYAYPGILLSRLKEEGDFWKAAKYYFDCILGPFKPFMRKALERLQDLEITLICTGHGPVLDTGIDRMLEAYEEWSRDSGSGQGKRVVIAYVSAYGYTRRLAEEIARGIRDSGEISVKSYDMVVADAGTALAEMETAEGILFGTPTIVGEALKPIWDLTTSMFAQTHGGKLAGVFGSYGWSGQGVPHIAERLRQLRMQVVDGLSVRFKPGEADLHVAYEYGYDFGCKILGKEKAGGKGPASLVKCLVCGEIFDSSLKICPVCGVGPENFVPVEAAATTYRRDTENLYAILGNGAAGIAAAKAIRERDRTGSIYVISNEREIGYNRPMLTKSLAAGLKAGQIAIQEEAWYKEQNICQLLGREVVSIDRKAKEILTADGAKFRYTRLIYALGAESFLPPIPGTELPEVISIRRLADTRKVTALLPEIKEAVVIGGGVLGLEAAWELKKAHCHVVVLEQAPRLMGRQLDEEGAEMLREICEARGVEIHTNAVIAAIEGREEKDMPDKSPAGACGQRAEEKHVTGVRLGDGTVIPARLVLLSCGVRANTAVAEAAGLETKRSVVVDSHMRTSGEDIYACGDCAQYEGQNYAIWPQAIEQGRVAGANAAGEELTYTPVPAAVTFHGMGTELFSMGDNGSDPDVSYRTVQIRDPLRKQYEKYYFRNGRLCGAILLGDTGKMKEVMASME